MNHTYSCDELYGTLLYETSDKLERLYFVLDCEYYKLYTWMYQYGWNKVKEKACERNGLRGYKVTLRTNPTK